MRVRTLPIGFAMFRAGYHVKWPEPMAGTALLTLTVLVLFLFFKQYFVKGIAMTGMKG